MASGAGMYELAREHIGEDYVNVRVPKSNANWRGPWDCAEFMSWLVFQDAGILYGCLDNSVNPATADAYTGAWQRDSTKIGVRIPIGQAAGTLGGIVLRYPPHPGAMGHIAICDGNGKTVEAKGVAFGVVEDVVKGRRWDTGVLIPGVHYEPNGKTIKVEPPPKIYHVGAPDLNKTVVRDIQQALLAAGLDPGPIDGFYGAKTSAAVAAFQKIKGLVPDGEVGQQTANALGIKL